MPRSLRPTERVGDAGVTLIEVVIASVLVMILAATAVALILQTQDSEVDNRSRIAAASLAARELDMITEDFRRTETAPTEIAAAGVVVNPHPLDGGTAGQELLLDGRAYTVTRSAAWNITGSGASACEGGSLVAYPELEITVAVTWGDMGSTRPVVASTSLAPEKGIGVATTDSFVAVSVVDAEGEPNSGRTVRVSNGASTRSGLTDASGCAVVQVTPASAGTNYTVSLDDTGYVDINGVQNPSKSTGTVLQGQLNNTVGFSYDLGGTITIRLVDSGGTPLAGALPTATQVTLVASEYSGSSGATTRTVDQGTTTLPGWFWPTHYGAYFGAAAPASGYDAQDLVPGGSITIDVEFAMANVVVTGAPAGASIIAVPSGGATTCTSPGAQGPFAQGSGYELMPGTWDLFAVGPASGPSFVCSPGPAGQVLNPDETAAVAWTMPTLVVQGAPVGNVWAVDRALLGAMPTGCPTGPVTQQAWNLGAGVVPTSVPAGDWVIYVTDGASDGVCVALMPAGNPAAVATTDLPRTVIWPLNSVLLNVTGIEDISGSRPYIFLAESPALTCASSAISSTDGSRVISLGRASYGLASGTVPEGTWMLIGARYTTCQLAGYVNVGPLSTALSIDYNASTPATVGP